LAFAVFSSNPKIVIASTLTEYTTTCDYFWRKTTMRKGMLPAVLLLFSGIHLQGIGLKAQQQTAPPPVIAPATVLQPTTTGTMQKYVPGDIKTEEVRTVSPLRPLPICLRPLRQADPSSVLRLKAEEP
jgi:hypothetical protein